MVVKKKAVDDCLIKVAGIEVRIPAHFEIAKIEPGKLPGQFLLYGRILASAEEQKILIDAEYRQWRAIYTGELITRDRKIPEWRARNRIEAEPEFLKFKTGRARAEKHVMILQAVVDSLQARLDLQPTV